MSQQDDDKKEIQRIRDMDSENLLNEFEGAIRRGAGTYYIQFNWLRKEVLKRMSLGEVGRV